MLPQTIDVPAVCCAASPIMFIRVRQSLTIWLYITI
nr:MAG TPA: hypothetical protein [Caudoviricetes sp.]